MGTPGDGDGASSRSQLDDLAALRAAEERRRRMAPGSPEYEAALEEERIIARRIRAWVEDRPPRRPPS